MSFIGLQCSSDSPLDQAIRDVACRYLYVTFSRPEA